MTWWKALTRCWADVSSMPLDFQGSRIMSQINLYFLYKWPCPRYFIISHRKWAKIFDANLRIIKSDVSDRTHLHLWLPNCPTTFLLASNKFLLAQIKSGTLFINPLECQVLPQSFSVYLSSHLSFWLCLKFHSYLAPLGYISYPLFSYYFLTIGPQ